MLFGRTHRKPISIPAKQVKEWKYTVCNYCSTGCAIELGLNDDGRIVLFLGTNFLHTMDAAVRRPGRFDEILLLDRPDVDARRALLVCHRLRLIGL